MKATWVLRALGFAVVACFVSSGRAEEPAPAAPDVSAASVGECQAQHERAKLLELDEKWLEAREAMKRCAVPSCPLAIRSDCSAWLDQLARLLPTLLIVIERDEQVKGQVRVELDGKPLALSDPPAPIEVLPGPHRLHFSLSGQPPIEEQLALDKGEKNRVVRVRFAAPAGAPAQVPPARAPTSSRPVPASTYVLASGALLALGTATALLVSALTSLDDARQRCAPVCSSDTRASIDRRLLAADVTAAAGIVLGGFAGYTFATRPTVTDSASAPGARARAGVTFAIQGNF